MCQNIKTWTKLLACSRNMDRPSQQWSLCKTHLKRLMNSKEDKANTIFIQYNLILKVQTVQIFINSKHFLSHLQQYYFISMKKLLDSTFQSTTNYLKNAPDIISRLSVHKNKNRIKEAIEVCRDYLTNFTEPPILKICAVKFLKDLFDEGLFYVLQLIQEHILPIFKEVILFRQQVKTIKRGYTFLVSKEPHPLKTQEVVELMSRYIKPSKSYFQLVHECVFFWSQYIEQEKSPFKTTYESVKHCTFPTNFKHFKESEVNTFKQKYKLEMNAIEYQLQDCVTKWEGVKNKLKDMEKKDFVRQNMQGFYNWITAFVTQYTNLLIDLKNSYYYQRKGLRQKMLSLLVEKKEFLKLYIQSVQRNSFHRLHERYGKPEQINQEFGIQKPKKVKKKKVHVEVQDDKLIDIKKIYLADYPEYLNKIDTTTLVIERNKHSTHHKKQDPSVDKIIKLPEITQNEHNVSKTIHSQPSIRISNVNEELPVNLKNSEISNSKYIFNIQDDVRIQTPSSFIMNPLKTQNSEYAVFKNSPPEPSSVKMPDINSRNILRNDANDPAPHVQRKVNASLGVLPTRQKAISLRSIQKKIKRQKK